MSDLVFFFCIIIQPAAADRTGRFSRCIQYSVFYFSISQLRNSSVIIPKFERAERGSARPSLSRLTVTEILHFNYKSVKFFLNFPENFVTKLLQIVTKVLSADRSTWNNHHMGSYAFESAKLVYSIHFNENLTIFKHFVSKLQENLRKS